MIDGIDDGNRTIIRPLPGGRRTGSSRAAGESVQSARPEISERSIPPAASGVKTVVGDDRLTAAAAPLLGLMARVHDAANAPEAGDLFDWAVRHVRIFEREARERGVPPDQLHPAHYALCISLDDVVLNTPWGTGTWRARPLISMFHRESGNQERFYEVLREMCNNPRKFLPVIKLMYLCLSLGFAGRYRSSGRGGRDVQRIRDEVYAIIARQQKEADSPLAPHTKGVQAPYRPTRVRLPLWVAACAGLGAIAALLAWFAISVNADSDALYAYARDLPPARMATATPASNAERPASSPGSTALDRVHTFLQPEIRQGFVVVSGTAAQPLIRVAAGSLFAAGSASIQPSSKPLLTRIGQALKGETGKVRVLGHTDDQSNRSLAFPSNAQLSAARAEAASAVIAAGIGDPSRIAFEGRAGAEPIASNDTAEGRERNRRIEIVLSGQER